MNKYIIACFFLLSKVTFASYNITDLFLINKTNLDFQIGSLNEKLYSYNADNSINPNIQQVNQDAENIVIAQSHFSWKIFYPWIDANIESWKGTSWTKDFIKNLQQKCYFSHLGPNEKKIRINYTTIYDVSLTNWLLNNTTYKLGVIFGHQNKHVISHTNDIKEKYSFPYIGFLGKIFYKNVSFNGTFKYSNQLNFENYESFSLKKEKNTDKKNYSHYYLLGLNLEYFLTSNFKIYTNVFLHQYNVPKVDLTCIPSPKNDLKNYLKKTSSLLTIGLNYTF